MTLRTPPPVVRADGHLCRAEFDPPDWVCPACRDTGGAVAVEDGYEVFQPCGCLAARRRLEMFNLASIGRQFADATLGSFKPKTQTQAQAQRRAEEFMLRYPAVDKGLLFYGPVGTGKTHLVVGIFRELTLRKGVGCRFIDYGQLLNDIRRSYQKRSGDAEIMVPLAQADLLVIDELGKGQWRNLWEQSVLDDLVSRRYNAGLTTLFTTNFSPSEPVSQTQSEAINKDFATRRNAAAGAPQQVLAERIGERIYSRICGMTELVPVGAEDHRRKPDPRAERGRRA